MDNKIDWVAKLTSRKFWMAVCGLVSGLLLAFKIDEGMVNEITGVIMAAASVVAYIIGEGLTDAARVSANNSENNLTAASGYVAWEPETRPPEDNTEDDLK